MKAIAICGNLTSPFQQEQLEEEIILTLRNGKVLKLESPYCGLVVAQALEHHLSPSPPQKEFEA
jgi:hypothetical protein